MVFMVKHFRRYLLRLGARAIPIILDRGPEPTTNVAEQPVCSAFFMPAVRSKGTPAMLGFDPADGGLVGVKRQGQSGGGGQVVRGTEGCAGEFGVVGDDH